MCFAGAPSGPCLYAPLCSTTSSSQLLTAKILYRKFRNIYSQERNCATTIPIPTFMFLCAIYLFPPMGLHILLQEKLGLRPRSPFSGNTHIEISLQCGSAVSTKRGQRLSITDLVYAGTSLMCQTSYNAVVGKNQSLMCKAMIFPL